MIKRNKLITKKDLRKTVYPMVHNGINATMVTTMRRNMKGHKYGEFAITKKLGRAIHFSKEKEKKEKTKKASTTKGKKK